MEYAALHRQSHVSLWRFTSLCFLFIAWNRAKKSDWMHFLRLMYWKMFLVSASIVGWVVVVASSVAGSFVAATSISVGVRRSAIASQRVQLPLYIYVRLCVYVCVYQSGKKASNNNGKRQILLQRQLVAEVVCNISATTKIDSFRIVWKRFFLLVCVWVCVYALWNAYLDMCLFASWMLNVDCGNCK